MLTSVRAATRHRVSCGYRCVTQQNADNSNVACAWSADYCVTHYTSLSQNRIILSWLDARSLFININNKQLRYSQLDGGTFQCEFNRIHSTLSIFYIKNMFKNLFFFHFIFNHLTFNILCFKYSNIQSQKKCDYKSKSLRWCDQRSTRLQSCETSHHQDLGFFDEALASFKLFRLKIFHPSDVTNPGQAAAAAAPRCPTRR